MNETFVQLDRLLDVGRHREARELVGRALAVDPADPTLHWFAARAAVGLDEVAVAEEHLHQALRIDPSHVPARFLSFAICFDAQRHAEAEQLITQLIREYPAEATYLAWYASLMVHVLDLAKARALVDEARRRDPENEQARQIDVLLLAIESRDEEAGRQLEGLIRDDPGSEQTARTLFVHLVRQGRHREALEIGRQLLLANPGDSNLVEALAELRASTHWLSLPAYPLKRYGWAASAVIWGGGILLSRVALQWNLVVGGVVMGLYLAYVVYTWVHLPLLKRWFLRRGF